MASAARSSPSTSRASPIASHPKKPPTVAAYAERWLATHSAPPFTARYAQAKRARFLQSYVLSKIGHVRLDRVTPRRATDLQRELFDQGLSRGTVLHALVSVAGSMWREAHREGLTKQLPFQGLRWPRKRYIAPKPFSEDEESAILGYFSRYAGGQYRLWIELLFGTGARPSEIAGARWGDWNGRDLAISRALVAREVTPGKTTRSLRTIVLAPHLNRRLAMERPNTVDPGAWLCVAQDGRPLDSTTWSGRRWKEALLALGIPHRRLYVTRHTWISRALSFGAPPVQVAEYVGTSLEKISQVYSAYIGDRTEDPLTAARRKAGKARG